MFSSLPTYVLPIIFVFVASGILFVLVMTVFEQRRRRPPQLGPVVLEMDCPDCSRELVIHKNELIPLSATEVALIVSAMAEDHGRRLGEYRCPYCRASHVFALDSAKPRYLTSDAFEPRPPGTYCSNCRKPLTRPPWPPGTFDKRLEEAKGLAPSHGLVCSRCGAISCVICVKDATRNRTKDRSFLCPRCYRGPVDRVHHF